MTASEALIYQMAHVLNGAGIDLTDERACIRMLMHGRFRAGDVAALVDQAMARARDAAVATEMARP